MKKIFFILTGLLAFNSCSTNETVEAQFDFDNAIQRVVKYESGTSKEELIDYVKNSSNADKTTYYFFYPKDVDVSVFTKKSFSPESFYSTVINSKPDYGLYKMPTDDKVFDDAVWVIEQAQK